MCTTYLVLTSMESSLGLCRERPATNRLDNGTVWVPYTRRRKRLQIIMLYGGYAGNNMLDNATW
jgi:hypothetical protein